MQHGCGFATRVPPLPPDAPDACRHGGGEYALFAYFLTRVCTYDALGRQKKGAASAAPRWYSARISARGNITAVEFVFYALKLGFYEFSSGLGAGGGSERRDHAYRNEYAGVGVLAFGLFKKHGFAPFGFYCLSYRRRVGHGIVCPTAAKIFIGIRIKIRAAPRR